MSTSNQPASKSFVLNDLCRELIGSLMTEPFAKKNGFDELTLDEIGLILEEPLGVGDSYYEHYDSCKSTYCLLLAEFELQGLTDFPDELRDLTLKELEPKAIFPTASLNPKENSEASSPISVLDKLSEIIHTLDIDLEKEPQTALHEIKASQLDLNHQTLELKFSNLENAKTIDEEYLNLATALNEKAKNGDNPISREVASRATTYFHILACEIALFSKIKEELKSIWPELPKNIAIIVQNDSFKFTETSEKNIAADETNHSQWLYQKRFPRAAALHCLRYLTLTRSFETFHPTAFDLGSLIYFWGTLSDCPFDFLSQLPREKRIEIAFRLFRLDRIKSLSQNFNRAMSTDQIGAASEDSKTILDSLTQTAGTDSKLREVA